MTTHKHRPRRVYKNALGGPFHLAQCHCGQVVTLSRFNKDLQPDDIDAGNSLGRYTLKWDVNERWRTPSSEEQELIDDFAS